MNTQNAFELLDDFDLANYAAHNVMKDQEPYMMELINRFVAYKDTFEAMAEIMGVSTEHLMAAIQLSGDEEYDFDRLTAVCRKLLKEL